MDDSGSQAFAELTERHRRELHVHCYRMLASFQEAEDAVQETLLRAWRSRDRFDGSTYFRAWLYRIATNVCLDMRHQNTKAAQSQTEVSWLEPYPDVLLDESEQAPEAIAVERETIELAFLVALQTLPPRQRAALIVRDVLGWPATETAVLLETSVAAANSALQRARSTMQEHLSSSRTEWSAATPSPRESELLQQFIDAHERCDAAAAAAIVAQGIRVTMPPYPWRFEGWGQISTLMQRARSEGEWRLVPTRANRLPAAASYLRRPGDALFRAFKLDVLRIENGVIAEITTFGSALFGHFGLTDTVSQVWPE